MKEIYLDTNVLLSPFHAGDPFAAQCLQILRTKRIAKVTSPLTFVELCAVISKLRHEGVLVLERQIEDRLSKLKPSGQVYALATFFLSFGSVKIAGMDTVVETSFDGFSVTTLLEFMEACSVAPSTLLRSLDNIHLAAVNIMVRQGRTIESFVTCDRGILERGEELKKVIDVPVVSPAGLVESLHV